jgi:hypothetical protein
MKILDKHQIKEKLGEFGVFSGKSDILSGYIQYLSGITGADQISTSVTMIMRPKGVEICLKNDFSISRVGLYGDQINFWTIEQQHGVVGNASKSVIGRALIGGLILGSVGAVVGGMTGLDNKQVNLSNIENIIAISYSSNNEELMILFSCSSKNLKKVGEYLKKNIGDKYRKPSEVQIKEEQYADKIYSSVADEIRKLKSLFDEGILSQDEFDQQKNKLLNK